MNDMSPAGTPVLTTGLRLQIVPWLFKGALTRANGAGTAATGRGRSGTTHVCRRAAEGEQRRRREVQSSGCCWRGTGREGGGGL